MKSVIITGLLLSLLASPTMASQRIVYDFVQLTNEADAAVIAKVSEVSKEELTVDITKIVFGDAKAGKLKVARLPVSRLGPDELMPQSEQIVFLSLSGDKWSLLGPGNQAIWPGTRYEKYAMIKSGTDIKTLVSLCHKIRSFEKTEPAKRKQFAAELAFNEDLFVRVIGLELCQYLRDNKEGKFTPEMELISAGGLEYLQSTIITDMMVFCLSVDVAAIAPSSVVLDTLIRPIEHPSVGQAEQRNAAMIFNKVAKIDLGYPLRPEKQESEKASRAVTKMQEWLQKHRGELLRKDLPRIVEHLNSDDVVMRRVGRIWLQAIPHTFAYKEDADEKSRLTAVKAFTEYVESLPSAETDIAGTQPVPDGGVPNLGGAGQNREHEAGDATAAPLAAQTTRPALTVKEARAVVGAAGRDLRVFQLTEGTDGKLLMQNLQRVFGDHPMVKVKFAYDERSHSLVAAGLKDELDAVVAPTVKALDAAGAASASTRPATTQPVTVPDGYKLIVGGHFHPEYARGDPRLATTQPVHKLSVNDMRVQQHRSVSAALEVISAMEAGAATATPEEVAAFETLTLYRVPEHLAAIAPLFRVLDVKHLAWAPAVIEPAILRPREVTMSHPAAHVLSLLGVRAVDHLINNDLDRQLSDEQIELRADLCAAVFNGAGHGARLYVEGQVLDDPRYRPDSAKDERWRKNVNRMLERLAPSRKAGGVSKGSR